MYTTENKLGPLFMPIETSTPSHSLPAPAAPPTRVCLLADDLTGACDAGAAFLTAGYSVRVWLGEKALFAASESVQAVNTASRGLPVDEAAEAVARAAAAIEAGADTILFKKIDSAARGPIAAELTAAQRALGAKMGSGAILFALGFPAMGRTVRNGVLEIRDASGQNSSVVLNELFPASMRDALVFVSHADELGAAIASGRTVLICDSATQDELNALARAAQSFAGLLYAGSGGLACAVAGTVAGFDQAKMPHAPRACASRTLVIAGTPHAVTKLQLEQLESNARQSRNAQVLRVECKEGDAAKIREAFHALSPDALILTGGDTALFAGQALGAHSILLKGEFAAGIPFGILQGGEAQGRMVVTKSGGFGLPSTLSDLIEHLSGAA
jgi:uncharacterized protein YgbK (DUF1537 family)